MSQNNVASLQTSAGLEYFRTDDLQRNLGRRTARGGIYTLAAMGVNFVIGAVGTVLLTRELTPDDFGLYGMVIFITGFAQLFVDWGLSRAVIQKPQITHEQVSTLFWFNIGISLLLALIVAASTPLVVAFYKEPRVIPINLAMSSLYLLGGLTMQHRALLQRRLEFGKLNIIATTAAATAMITAIIIAVSGGGYWALVAIPGIAQLVSCVGVWYACRWRPGPPRRNTGARQMLAFGGHVAGFQFINYLLRHGDQALVGYFWGAIPLGLYTRAYSLMMLPANRFNTPVTQVIVPALSRLQEFPDRYREAYRRSIRMVAAITTIPTTLLILIAPEVLPILFGQRWNDVVPVFVALGPAAIMAGTNVAGGWLYMSCGHVHRLTRWVLIASPFLVLPVVLTLPYGILAVAVAVSISRVLMQLPSVSYACKGTPVRTRDYIEATFFVVTVPFIAACFSGLIYVLWACQLWGLQPSLSYLWEASELASWPAMKAIAFKVVLMGGMLLATALVWPAAREAYWATLSEVKRFRQKKRGVSEPTDIQSNPPAEEVGSP